MRGLGLSEQRPGGRDAPTTIGLFALCGSDCLSEPEPITRENGVMMGILDVMDAPGAEKAELEKAGDTVDWEERKEDGDLGVA